MNKKRGLWIAFFVILTVVAWNFPSTYQIGVDGAVSVKNIPLYAKACGFLYRDWAYRDIIKEVVGDPSIKGSDKVLHILEWTNKNIANEVPIGLKVIDDHPLNIIIRQYGTKEQVQDIFAILCEYAGFKAGMEKLYSLDRKRLIVLSFVRVSSRWLIFDAARSKYFLNKKGNIGSVEDYLNGELILSGDDAAKYSEFLDDVKNVDFSSFTRSEEQMPLRRVQIELMKFFWKKSGSQKGYYD